MHPKYREVIKLREKGKSYREVAKIVNVSKSSVSKWCKGLKLSPFAQKIIERKIKTSQDQLVNYNKRRHHAVKLESEEIRKRSASQIHSLSEYELLLIGTALYWGEGYKKIGERNSPYISFVNSDPDMIALFLRFLREVLQIPENKLRVSVRIHPNISERSVINFWTNLTDIPRDRFRVTRQVSKSSKGKRPSNMLPYGVLDLRVNKRQRFRQIEGWIEGLTSQSTRR